MKLNPYSSLIKYIAICSCLIPLIGKVLPQLILYSSPSPRSIVFIPTQTVFNMFYHSINITLIINLFFRLNILIYIHRLPRTINCLREFIPYYIFCCVFIQYINYICGYTYVHYDGALDILILSYATLHPLISTDTILYSIPIININISLRPLYIPFINAFMLILMSMGRSMGHLALWPAVIYFYLYKQIGISEILKIFSPKRKGIRRQ